MLGSFQPFGSRHSRGPIGEDVDHKSPVTTQEELWSRLAERGITPDRSKDLGLNVLVLKGAGEHVAQEQRAQEVPAELPEAVNS